MRKHWTFGVSTCLGTYSPLEDECGLQVAHDDSGVMFRVWLERTEVEELVSRLNLWLKHTQELWAKKGEP